MISSILRVAGAIATTAILAQATLHITPDVPVSGQTLAVFTWAFFLTPIEAVVAMSGYLLLGGLGLPIFADGVAGWSVLGGPSGGYLLGFIPAAVMIASRRDSDSANNVLAWTMLATVVVLALGFGRLAWLKGIGVAWQYGVQPFLPGAAIKALLGTAIVLMVRKISAKQR